MARLQSEDRECESYLEIAPAGAAGPMEAAGADKWQPLRLTLQSGGRRLELGTEGSGQALVCRQPRDEIAVLLGLLDELADNRRERVLFEPSEPSFELALERTREGGIQVFAWFDAGNATSGFYRWDAAGVRFYLLTEGLKTFIAQLKDEFFP